jgi:hypothetical protein
MIERYIDEEMILMDEVSDEALEACSRRTRKASNYYVSYLLLRLSQRSAAIAQA